MNADYDPFRGLSELVRALILLFAGVGVAVLISIILRAL